MDFGSFPVLIVTDSAPGYMDVSVRFCGRFQVGLGL